MRSLYPLLRILLAQPYLLTFCKKKGKQNGLHLCVQSKMLCFLSPLIEDLNKPLSMRSHYTMLVKKEGCA